MNVCFVFLGRARYWLQRPRGSGWSSRTEGDSAPLLNSKCFKEKRKQPTADLELPGKSINPCGLL